MKNKNFGFTLIELLVVIVIIGILATISTATFSGYFKKSRDTERQSFVRNAQQILIAAQVASDSPDYDLGGTTGATVATAVRTALTAQGYAVPAAKNGVNYYLLLSGVPNASVSSDFAVFACKEDSLGSAATTTDPNTVAFMAGTASFVANTAATGERVISNINLACATTPAAPVAAVDSASPVNWSEINLSCATPGSETLAGACA